MKTGRWSYSRWSTYNKCPSQYEWFYKLKKPRTSSPALKRGLDIHGLAEDFVSGVIRTMPKELYNFKEEFIELKKQFKLGYGSVEPDISMTKKLKKSTMKKTDYFIGFADYRHEFKRELTVIDYKTGKKYPEHQDQGHAYSTALMATNPKIEKLNVEFWYLDMPDWRNNLREFTYTREDLPRMLKIWENRINVMYSDTEFEKVPNKFCSWCARHKKNGGDCSG